MLFFILQICLKTKVHITSKTESKLGTGLEPGGVFFQYIDTVSQAVLVL